MALNTRLKVKLLKKGITIRRSEKHQYVYKVLSTFRTENGQPTNTRRSIGKLDPESGLLIPNNAYWELYGDSEYVDEITPAIESVRSVGATFLVTKILESLCVTEILKKVFGEVKAAAILTSVIYMVCRGNVFERIQDFCEENTLKEAFLTSPNASVLFSSITYKERMAFFKEWSSRHSTNGYLAYDVTSFSTYATGIHDAEWGYNRDNDNLPQINLGCYVNQENKLPIFYVTYPGSIVDKSHLPYIMAYNKELGIGDVCFVMDKGFCTTDNIKHMHTEKLSYLISVDTSRKEIRSAIAEAREGIVSIRNVAAGGVYAKTVQSEIYGSMLTIHIYYDPVTAERMRSQLYRNIDNQEKILSNLKLLTKQEAKRYRKYFDIKLSEDGSFSYEINCNKIDELSRNCGFFCLLTNKEMDSKTALVLYRRKDVIEKGFDDIKNHIDMKRLRTHNSSTTDGKLFCAFIALIAVSQMANHLSDYMKEKSLSKDGLLSQLEKIKVVLMTNGYRILNPITKTQRLIFDACGLDEDDLKNYVYG